LIDIENTSGMSHDELYWYLKKLRNSDKRLRSFIYLTGGSGYVAENVENLSEDVLRDVRKSGGLWWEISRSGKLGQEFIWDYRVKLNWRLLISNTNIVISSVLLNKLDKDTSKIKPWKEGEIWKALCKKSDIASFF
jgi:hypothetical protein